MREFENRRNQMLIGGVQATDIVERFGSPVMVTDESALRSNYRNIFSAFNKRFPTRINYACKANTNLSLLRILEQEGSCIDAVSVFEAELCLRAGFPPERILYTGVSVSNKEMEAVVNRNIPINIDSLGQLRRLAVMKKGHPISLRVNPDVGSGHSHKVNTGSKGAKFGIPKDRIVDAFAEAMDLGFHPSGIHAHTGSGGRDPDVFARVTDVMLEMVDEIRSRLGLKLEFLDIGGGMGIPYRPEEEQMDLDMVAEAVTSRIRDSCLKTLVIEPGRYIVADTTVLLTKVNDVKETEVRNFVLVEAGFNTLIRPAFYESYHHVAVANRFGATPEMKYDVVGPICETGDHLAKERMLPKVRVGDVICVYDCGAYGFTMSSNYNSRPKCAEVLVNEGQSWLIREAETMDDLVRHQKIPARLMV